MVHIEMERALMLERMTRVNFLYDFYHALLTDKQKSYMDAYYLEDLSLGEIADEHEVSRQAVYDNVKRTEALLEQYEEKLKLFEKFQRRMAIIQQLQEATASNTSSEVAELLARLKETE